MPPRETLSLTWDDFDQAANVLADRVRRVIGKAKPGIIGAPRGGLPLAVALSHRLGLSMLTDTLTSTPWPIIWVDDILDRGHTYLDARKRMPNLIPVVWVNKQPDYANVLAHLIAPADAWVLFPWEVDANVEADREAYEAKR